MSEPSIKDKIDEVDASLSELSTKWIADGKNPRSDTYKKINGLLDRRARLMEKRDGVKLLVS